MFAAHEVSEMPMMQRLARRPLWIGLIGCAVLLPGCDSNVSFLSSSFVNTLSGGVYPVTPGPRADFVLVRAINSTDRVITFFVTVERTELVPDEEGRPQLSEDGELITRDVMETVELTTRPGGRASEMGYLFPCSESSGPVIRVGLGENLMAGDAAIFVIETDDFNPELPVAFQPGVGLPATGQNPLRLDARNFACGDTVIFRAFRSTGTAGGVRVETFLLPGSEQPDQFSGLNTFVNYEDFLESQVTEEEFP
jgi:hypothetical protein